MRAFAKEIAFDQSSRAAIQAGIDKLADAIGFTLGRRGSFVFILSLFFFFVYGIVFILHFDWQLLKPRTVIVLEF